MSWRWWKPEIVFLLVFVIAWDAFLLYWYFGLNEARGLLFKIFPIAHVAVGVGLTYYVLAGFVNRTTVTATSGLCVQHGPLPWRGNRTIAATDLKQLYVKQVEHTHRDKQWGRTTTLTHDLCALLETGREVHLLRRLDHAGQGKYLEHTFEKYLGIDDRRIAGELAKP